MLSFASPSYSPPTHKPSCVDPILLRFPKLLPEFRIEDESRSVEGELGEFAAQLSELLPIFEPESV